MQLPPFKGRVEFSGSFRGRSQISHVLFDFDGTLSLIREGWPEVMVPMFVEMLPRLPGETEAERRQLALRRHHAAQRQADDLPDDPARRAHSTSAAATPQEPLWYKHEYLRRLDERIRSRIDGIRSGTRRAKIFWCTARCALLDDLRGAGLRFIWPAAPTSSL